MLKAAGHIGDQLWLGLGLDGEKLTRLIAGEPILVNATEVGLPRMWVLLTGGTTAGNIAETLRPAMTDPVRNQVDVEDTGALVTGLGEYQGEPLLVIGLTPAAARRLMGDQDAVTVDTARMGLPVAAVTVLAGKTADDMRVRLRRESTAAMAARHAAG